MNLGRTVVFQDFFYLRLSNNECLAVLLGNLVSTANVSNKFIFAYFVLELPTQTVLTPGILLSVPT